MDLSFTRLATSSLRFRFRCNSGGDPIEPVRNGIVPVNRPGLTSQHKERGLKTVLAVLDVAQSPPADTPDQTAVAFHQGGKSSFISLQGEAFEELSVWRF